jgi:hypothetical protein
MILSMVIFVCNVACNNQSPQRCLVFLFKDQYYFTGNSLGLQPKLTQEYILMIGFLSCVCIFVNREFVDCVCFCF